MAISKKQFYKFFTFGYLILSGIYVGMIFDVLLSKHLPVNTSHLFIVGLVMGSSLVICIIKGFRFFDKTEKEHLSHIDYLMTILTTNSKGETEDTSPYPNELAIAIKAWQAVSNVQGKGKPKARIRAWLDERYTDNKLSNVAKERISVVANWDKTGGAARMD
ncbi:MAG: hypothetical protein PSV17_00460 [Methylotenera sp.]|uniref:hypothetical protein n=1 Tax=Methylotenera sp. TaxID=2051956 RepID=UPI002489DEE8|nr:hypothetical protein [Methylotenera sp.]MDI1307888.1 hypothetical protein [Methylotenera sp.]